MIDRAALRNFLSQTPCVPGPPPSFNQSISAFATSYTRVLHTISFESKLLDEKKISFLKITALWYETQETIDYLFKVGTNSGCFLKERLAGPAEIPGTHFLIGLWSTTYHVFSGCQTGLYPPSLFSQLPKSEDLLSFSNVF